MLGDAAPVAFRGMRRRHLVVLALLAASCVTEPGAVGGGSVEGPARVQLDVVRRHALQFDEELSERPAGSQEEFLAATYIVAHLQKAGYTTRLDGVPVENLIRSTNVVALPPSGDEAAAIVAVGYDTGPGREGSGEALGTFLELARALRVGDADHPVEFVALGGQVAAVGGGFLGSRVLGEQMLEQDVDAPVIIVGGPARALRVSGGDLANRLNALAEALDTGTAEPEGAVSPDVARRAAAAMFGSSEVDHAVIEGPPQAVAELLMSYLQAVGV